MPNNNYTNALASVSMDSLHSLYNTLPPQQKPISFADSANKECNICDNSIAVFTRKSVAIEIHTLPRSEMGHFLFHRCIANSHAHTRRTTTIPQHITPLLNALTRDCIAPSLR